MFLLYQRNKLLPSLDSIAQHDCYRRSSSSRKPFYLLGIQYPIANKICRRVCLDSDLYSWSSCKVGSHALRNHQLQGLRILRNRSTSLAYLWTPNCLLWKVSEIHIWLLSQWHINHVYCFDCLYHKHRAVVLKELYICKEAHFTRWCFHQYTLHDAFQIYPSLCSLPNQWERLRVRMFHSLDSTQTQSPLAIQVQGLTILTLRYKC